MTEATEARYTLDEARTEMRRQECAADRHRPDLEVREVAQELGVWYCACLTYEWRASAAEPIA